MHEVLEFVKALPPDNIASILAVLGGSTVVASILQLIKHKFGIQDAKELVTILLVILSTIASLADYIVQSGAANPDVLGKHTAFVLSGAVLIHRFAVSPAYAKIVEKLNLIKIGEFAVQNPQLVAPPLEAPRAQVFEV
jgi:hypothetical protein